MNASPESRALALTEPIYAAVVDPGAWDRFLAGLARELGDPGIAMSIMLPGWERPPVYHRVNLSERYVPAFERIFRLGGLPWTMTHPAFRDGFGSGCGVFPDERLTETEFYREYMEPQGLAPEAPVAHLISSAEGRPVSGVCIWRRVGGRPFGAADLETCNLLVPHLSNATMLRHARVRADEERTARTEILDRIPVGILVLDLKQRVIVTNRAAQEILEAADGVVLRDGVLHAARPRDERELQRMIREAIRFDPNPGFATPFEPGYLAIERPSGAPAYAAVVTRVFSSPKRSAVGDEVAAIFIGNPTPGRIAHANTFRELFGLTRAEAEVVALMSVGNSLEEISEIRGVTIHTTRTLLKRVFAKTQTNRQGEIVRLVLAGGATLGYLGPGSEGD